MKNEDSELTNEPKLADAPDNLFAPISGYDTVEGDFGDLSVPSLTDWLDQNLPVKWGAVVVAAACGFAAVLGGLS